jgi:hypothetical protein
MKKIGMLVMIALCLAGGAMGQGTYPAIPLASGYPAYSPTTNELIPGADFQKVFRNHFSFLATGQSTTSAGVSSLSIDLLDARFDIKGSIPLTRSTSRRQVFINLGLSGNRDGNVVSLFNGSKAGGKFDGEIAISFMPKGKFFWLPEQRVKIYGMMKELDRKYYPEFIRLRDCTGDLPDGLCDEHVENDAFNILFAGSRIDKLNAFADTVRLHREKVYSKAQWSSVHMFWVTAKGKMGGNEIYTISQTMNYVTDSVQKHSLLTGRAALELNYFYERPDCGMLYANLGIGPEWTDNLKDLKKVAVTESISMKDTLVVDPNGQKRDIADKYDAYSGTITKKLNLLVYANAYFFPGNQRLFGLKLGAEYRDDVSTTTDTFCENTSLIGGFIANIPKKGDAKSLVGVEIFLRVNGIDRIDFDNDHNTSVGLAFNVPIPMLPK